MAARKKDTGFLRQARRFITLLLSMAGYVPQHATIARTLAMLSSLGLVFYLTTYHPADLRIAILYYLISLASYIGFIALVLRKDGARLRFIRRWGEEGGYRTYEGILGFLFFNSGASLGYVASASVGSFFPAAKGGFLFVIVTLAFVAGFIIKIWAAKVVSIDIYYWKDMFLGRKICSFVVTGPYKYFSNPMYGIGQLQAYAAAAYYGSWYGLLAAAFYQGSVFTFYYAVEKDFIRRTYQKGAK